MKTSRAPLIVAIVLLLLPVLYVGSFYALVMPQGRPVLVPEGSPKPVVHGMIQLWQLSHYRFGHVIPSRVYWPLEQIDRKLRPRAWELMDLSHGGGGPTHQKVPDLSP